MHHLLALLPLAWTGPAAAEAPVGEALRFEIRYAGVVGGTAWLRSSALDDERVRIEAGAQNAPWYAALYTLDDLVVSTWRRGAGSQRYETRFREGRFHQDQDMRLDGDPFTVWRNSEGDEGWAESTSSYAAHPGAQDPLSAIYALRDHLEEGPFELPVFSGKKTWPLRVEPTGTEVLKDTPLGTVTARVLELKTRHEGDWEQRGRFVLYVTDDPRRIPLRAVIRTNVGPVRADLIAYQAPDGTESDVSR